MKYNMHTFGPLPPAQIAARAIESPQVCCNDPFDPVVFDGITDIGYFILIDREEIKLL